MIRENGEYCGEKLISNALWRHGKEIVSERDLKETISQMNNEQKREKSIVRDSQNRSLHEK